MKRRPFLLIVVALIMSLLCVAVPSPVAAQSVSLNLAKIEKTDKGFVVKGTVTGSNLNPEGQLNISNTVSVIADIKEGPDSVYPKLPKGWYVRPPAGAETPYTEGSGPGGTMTKKEYYGVGIISVTIASFGIGESPAEFEGTIPLEYAGKTLRIRASLKHYWSGTWPAMTFHHDTGYEGKLEGVAPLGEVMSLEDILKAYKAFGTSAHTWPDGTTDKKALTGPAWNGASANFWCSLGYTEYCRFTCTAMQYKVLWFLNDLERAGKLTGWEYSAVYGVCPPYPEHNAVVIWEKGKDWKRVGIILDPHGKQKPHYCSTETSIFPWKLDEDIFGVYSGTKTPWNPTGEKKPTRFNLKDNRGAIFCPVDVLIVNSAGQRLGVLPNGDKVSEFKPTDSYYWEDEKGDKQWFFSLPDDTYEVSITGTGSGKFNLLAYTPGEDVHDYGENPIAAGEQAILTMEPEKGDELTLADGSKVTPKSIKVGEPDSASEGSLLDKFKSLIDSLITWVKSIFQAK